MTKNINNEMLSDEELENVSGGNGSPNDNSQTYACGDCSFTWSVTDGSIPTECPSCHKHNIGPVASTSNQAKAM